MNYRVMARFLGYIFAGTGALMVFSLLWAVWFWEPYAIAGLAAAMGVSILLGALLVLYGRNAPSQIYQREALGLVGIAWLGAGFVGALPYWFSGELTFVNALFESTSGFTTTGSSILTDIEAMPKGLLFWRSFTHWMGGIGIVVLFIAVLPYLGAGGKMLFRSESTGPDPRALKPRVRESASVLCTIYVSLTLIQTVLLMLCGSDFYDALCHTFGTLATGGFSTHGNSIAHYNSVIVEIIIIVFMILASTNFALYFELRKPSLAGFKRIVSDTEWRAYVSILAIATLLVTLNLTGWIGGGTEFHAGPNMAIEERPSVHYEPAQALRAAAFTVVSISSTTGYATDDSNQWPPLSRALIVILTCMGGCAGSTSGGFKIVRVVLMFKIAYWRLEKTFRPKTYRAVRLNNTVVDEETQRTIASFMVIYGAWVVLGALFLSALGMPSETALTAVLATINGVGPGLEFVGATGNFALIPDSGKLFLILTMVLGRLELFTITVLLMPAFWRIGR